MKLLLFTVALFTSLISEVAAQAPANIVIMTVEDPSNYDAVNSMRSFAEKELRPLGHRVTLIEGDKPVSNHFAGLVEALKEADLLVLFVRRRTPPKDQLDAVRAYLDAGKPLLGIRTANHAFVPKPKDPVQDERLASWPEFTPEVLGGQNTGYETKGIPYSVSVLPGATGNPLLKGVNAEKIIGHNSLYKVLPLAPDATPLLLGTAQGQQPSQPIAWARLYGKSKARIFYTSLGAPDDMPQPDVRRLLLNGIQWTLGK
ncbi:MAG: ThuA domain-containing protein [Verrucomicrobiota bacterium]|nr:ThuA domain-containing protein [Verrucomicrobiota bacterium]